MPLILAIIAGCATPPPSTETVLPPSYRVSRDGILHYRLPEGWFDATADTAASGPVVWILRKDYGATITVSEIHMDAQARRDLSHGGLLQLAQLTQSLGIGNESSIVLHAPEMTTANGREMCTYDLLTSKGMDTVRVLLFDTGEHVYAVSALRQGPNAGERDIFSVEREFVEGLRW